MLAKLIPIFIIVPLVELALLIEVGRFLGTLNTIVLVIVTALVGAVLAKIEGVRVWYHLQEDLMNFKLPTDCAIDGVLILIGGILLFTPGILTDVLGLFLIIPWTRYFFRERIKNKFKNKIKYRPQIKHHF